MLFAARQPASVRVDWFPTGHPSVLNSARSAVDCQKEREQVRPYRRPAAAWSKRSINPGKCSGSNGSAICLIERVVENLPVSRVSREANTVLHGCAPLAALSPLGEGWGEGNRSGRERHHAPGRHECHDRLAVRQRRGRCLLSQRNRRGIPLRELACAPSRVVTRKGRFRRLHSLRHEASVP